jgi:hypothetical protein
MHRDGPAARIDHEDHPRTVFELLRDLLVDLGI